MGAGARSACRSHEAGLPCRVWGPSQRITLDQALKVCTVNGAYAAFDENNKGTITAGKLADFIFLEKDPHDVDPWRSSTSG